MILGYLRVSTAEQDTDNQKNKLLDYANKNKIIIDDFIEVELSSRKTARERKLNEVTDKLAEGDKLLVTELSRLGRNMLEVLNIINNLNNKGIEIIFINQPELNSTGNNALDSFKFAIYGFVAQTERDFISTRTKQALDNLKAKGIKLGHGREFLKSKYDNDLEQILELRKMGLSFNKICNFLDKDNLKGYKEQSLKTYFNKRFIMIDNDIKMRDNYKKFLGE